MIRASRVGPLVVAVAAGALLFVGPAFAEGGGTPSGSGCATASTTGERTSTGGAQTSTAGTQTTGGTSDSSTCPSTGGTSSTASTAGTSESSTTSQSGTAGTSTTGTSTQTGTGAPSGTGSTGGASNRDPANSGVGGPGGPGQSPNRLGRPAGDRDCADFATQDQAQEYFESIGGSRTNNADRLDENHNGVACESLSDDGDNQDAAVTTTGDDGSDAKTSGDQVTEVPEGSAQTGGN